MSGYDDFKNTVIEWKIFFKQQIEHVANIVIEGDVTNMTYVQLMKQAENSENFSAGDLKNIAFSAAHTDVLPGFSNDARQILNSPTYFHAKNIGSYARVFDRKQQAKTGPMVSKTNLDDKLFGLLFHDTKYPMLEIFIESDNPNEVALPDMLVIDASRARFSANGIELYTIKPVARLADNPVFAEMIQTYGLGSK